MNVYMNRFGEQVETVTTETLLESWPAARGSAGSHELQPLASRADPLAKRDRQRAADRQGMVRWFLKTDGKFGGATSFLRAPGQGLWQSGGATEKDRIAVVEVMVEAPRRTLSGVLCANG